MTLRCDLIIRDATVFDGLGAARFEPTLRSKATGSSRSATWAFTKQTVMSMPMDWRWHPALSMRILMTTERCCAGRPCMLCKMSQGVTTVVVGNCGISLSPVRMTSRPVPPLDLLGDESWFCFDSFGEYAERLTREPVR